MGITFPYNSVPNTIMYVLNLNSTIKNNCQRKTILIENY